MSKYDTISVAGNNLGITYTRPHFWFQTNELGNNLFTYAINSNNQLVHYGSDEHITRGLRKPTEPLRYVGDLEIYLTLPDENRKLQTIAYILTFENFKIIKARLKTKPEPIIFEGKSYDPARMIAKVCE